MYRVLIVDDEKVIRMAMKSIIHWENYNYQVVGIAADGKVALDMMEELKPDLIITDLKMPNVDGIELIKEVKRKSFDCKILVLSNYGDYELVRVAMKEGAVDYLLKITLASKELINVLKNIEGMLKKESKEREYRIQLEKEMYENKYLIKRSFLLNLIEVGGEEKDKFKDSYEKYSLQHFEKVNILLHIRIDNISQIYSEKIKDKNQLVVAITNIIDETIPYKSP